MAEFPHTDDVSSLAHELAERIVDLCPHVPPGELASLTSRLALAEHAHVTGVPFGDAATPPDLESVVPGNHIVWLPGSSSAIVLPAGAEPAGPGSRAASLLDWAQRRATPIRSLATRGSAVLRQLGAALINAYQTRAGVQ